MKKTMTYNGKRYDLMKIKTNLETQWDVKFDGVNVNKDRSAVYFTKGKYVSVSVPFVDLEDNL